MFKRIPITLDGSPLSEQALEKAVQIAETSRAELRHLFVAISKQAARKC